VRYNGVDVGQVLSIGLDPDDPGEVRVRIEVGAETPVKTDTTASL
jgi:phospholipid/cholesterol/gamma-HCH transport system substrate-binding protein